VNFFKSECQQTINEARFGLYDAQDNSPVIIMTQNEQDWNATVINGECKSILFTAIDNCIEVLSENGDMDKRCDCMLTYDSTLLLIELKNKKSRWQEDGLEQIENIVKRMIADDAEYYYGFNKRKAVVANKKKKAPEFQKNNNEQRQYFNSQYKMKIQFESEIILK
jgi:hypothetical protein